MSLGVSDPQRDGFGVGARRDDKVILKFSPLGAVINQVDAGINAFVPDLCVGGNIRAPFAGVVANEVIGFAGQLVSTGHDGVGIRAQQL